MSERVELVFDSSNSELGPKTQVEEVLGGGVDEQEAIGLSYVEALLLLKDLSWKRNTQDSYSLGGRTIEVFERFQGRKR